MDLTQVLIGTALLVAPLNLLFLFVNQYALIAVVYIVIYQVTNGTWSGAGYACQAESFPTRVRGTTVGFLGAMFAGGFLIGSALWTILVTFATPAVAYHRHGPSAGSMDDVAAAQNTPRTGAGGDSRFECGMR